VEAGVELATRCEQAAFAVSPQIANSEGATVSIQEGQFVSANSLGFIGGYPSSRHYLSCSVIAGKNEHMQRDDWYVVARDPQAIGAAEAIGEQAARRALSRLGARKVKTCKVPVHFRGTARRFADRQLSCMRSAAAACTARPPSWSIASASASSRRVQISERPHLPGALASSYFDSDGVRPRTAKWSATGACRAIS
jgi:PmbA protein